jgi:osmotically-inducible protein OsmY
MTAKVTDTALRQMVVDALEFEPSIDAADIGVAVEDGVVSLTGHVGSYVQMLTAERIVQNVKGVRAVAQNLEVRLAPGEMTTDDQIAKRAANTLAWDGTLPPNLKVTVQGGWVTLAGEVEWQYQKATAENDVKALLGIKGVTNKIAVKPKTMPRVEEIKRKIEEALRRHAAIDAQDIAVNVTADGTVILEGKVDDWDERYAVENAAWSAQGVHNVSNRLKVV